MNEQRKNERKKLIAFTPVYDCQRNILLGYLGDLSLQGAMLIGKKPLEINKQIILAIGFPETPQFPARRATIPARVAWCRQEQNPQYFNVGFEFLEIDQENKAAIKAIMDRYRFRYKVPSS
jgi:hypothetical protein